jgi:segregation and condensation protein B
MGEEEPKPPADGEDLLQFGDRIDDGGLSLDDLSETFAEMINSGDDPYLESPRKQPTLATPLQSGDEAQLDDESQLEDKVEVSPRSILEAMLFVGHPENRPITSREVAALMRGVRPQEIDDLVEELNAVYNADGTTYHVVSRGDGFVLELRPEFASVRDRFYGKVKAAKLTPAAVDVLAIVAYNQPSTKKEVNDARSKSSGALLNQLVRRELLRIERTDTKPRITTYHTTDRFLEIFGIGNLDELPSDMA